MLNGNLTCKDIKKLFLQYIHFEMNKKEMGRVARHLRNCPKCFNEYSKLQKRKKELRKKMDAIEKNLILQNQISEYYDSECNIETACLTTKILHYNEIYQKELLRNKKLTEFLKVFNKRLKKSKDICITKNVIRKTRRKHSILLFLQPLRLVLSKLR